MDLYEAFGLSPPAIVAAVGGGGKTSLVYRLAEEAAGRGLSAVVTTTTRFTRPSGMPLPAVVETDDVSAERAIRAAARPGAVVVAISGRLPQARMSGFAPETLSRLDGVGLVAIEADGSAHRPFKAPAEHEPVIPAAATDVVVCVGLSVLGEPLDDEHVHRASLVASLAKVGPGSPVVARTIVDVLLSPEGGRKGVPEGARLHALLNSPRHEEDVRAGTNVGQRVVFGGYCRAVIATAHVPGDVRAVIQ